MLRPPDGGAGVELSRFVQPDHEPGSPAAMSTDIGLRNVAFEVDDLQAAVDRLATDSYGLVGGVDQYKNLWRMAYVRGPSYRLTRPNDGETKLRRQRDVSAIRRLVAAGASDHAPGPS